MSMHSECVDQGYIETFVDIEAHRVRATSRERDSTHNRVFLDSVFHIEGMYMESVISVEYDSWSVYRYWRERNGERESETERQYVLHRGYVHGECIYGV